MKNNISTKYKIIFRHDKEYLFHIVKNNFLLQEKNNFPIYETQFFLHYEKQFST